MPRKLEIPDLPGNAKEYKSNPEIDAKINKFIAENPNLVRSIQEMPRERLERKYFLIRAEQIESRIGYREKVAAWLDDNPDVKERLEKQFGHLRNQKQRDQMIFVAASGEVRSQGVRL